ncbi:methylated-DNA--[protein]-cysteine S-methyltransferase [Desulfolucanica intricata]|uniref:methylated-DNA--[protein]-cysteine S-methyltransferase n=1 Tax=Desulfolucanica intricata TaxID=1285191 RepID=UPI00082CC803|nr:methylated-DNA--[protein]-cysteine S-methyltransferase [Desulfolucanica intricata]
MKTEYIYKYNSHIGMLTVLSDGENITGLWIKNIRNSENSEIIEVDAGDLPVFEKTREWLDCYFDGKEPDFMPPVKTKGTEFRQSVWRILREIPYGKVITYGDIAGRIALQTGKTKMSARAVGGAVGNNPVSILIPCHRVVGAKGNLTGYGGGLDIKVRLMQLEGMDMSRFHMPSKKRQK